MAESNKFKTMSRDKLDVSDQSVNQNFWIDFNKPQSLDKVLEEPIVPLIDGK